MGILTHATSKCERTTRCRTSSFAVLAAAGRCALLRALAMTSNTSCRTASSSRVASRVAEPELVAEHEHGSAARRGLAACGACASNQSVRILRKEGTGGRGLGTGHGRRTGAVQWLRKISDCRAGQSVVPAKAIGTPLVRLQLCMTEAAAMLQWVGRLGRFCRPCVSRRGAGGR